MEPLQKYLRDERHWELVEELLALCTPEDRLSWLMERTPFHAELSAHDRIESRKVPGCLSGLWLKAELVDGRCFFSAQSESDLVHGVVSFICDLYSNRSCEEILSIGDALTSYLKIDGLLSTTRKRALSSTLSFINATASSHSSIESAA
jgi:cysteine desulfuration protein SufE